MYGTGIYVDIIAPVEISFPEEYRLFFFPVGHIRRREYGNTHSRTKEVIDPLLPDLPDHAREYPVTHPRTGYEPKAIDKIMRYGML